MSELARMLAERAAEAKNADSSGGLNKSLSDIFSFEPVPLREFVEGKQYLDGVVLSSVQYETLRHVERIYYDGWVLNEKTGVREYDPAKDLYSRMAEGGMSQYWAEKVRMVNFITLQWGKGSGKDLISEYATLRVAYLLLALKSPQEYFGKPSSDQISMLNVAASAKQANKVFFKPLRTMASRGWFADKCKVTQDSIEFDKNIEAVSGHSDADTQEGMNLILGVADEIDGFSSREMVKKGGAEPMNSVESILDMLQTSSEPQPLDALVLTPDRGFIRMGDIKVGDVVIDPKGMPSSVQDIIPQGVLPIYRLTFSDGTSVEAAGSHLWEFERMSHHLTPLQKARGEKERRTEIVTTLQAMERMKTRKSYSNRPYQLASTDLHMVDFVEDDLPIDPYLLGILLGDGSVSHYSPELTSADQEIFDSCAAVLPKGMDMVLAHMNTENCATYRLRGKGKGYENVLTKALRDLGVWGQRAWDKHVPVQYKHASAKNRLAILQGLMDTDGHYANGHSGFASSSETLRNDVLWLARSLGLRAKAQPAYQKPVPKDGKEHNYHLMYGARIQETEEVRVFRLRRKLKPVGVGKNKARRSLISIEYTRNAEAQCISVSAASHLYVTDDFIATHNSRYPQTFKNIRMSYPRFKGSYIQKLTEEAREDLKKYGEASNHYLSGPLPTWEVNPSRSRVYFQKAYDKDPILAAAKYECKPALAINAFFSNEIAVKAAFTDKEQPVKIERYKLVNDKYWAPVYSFADDFVAIRGANYAMHGDLAVTADRAGIAMSHVVRYEEIETNIVGENGELNTFLEMRPVVKCDFVISFTSDKATVPPRDIQIRWARQLCVELLQKGFSIQLFTFDKFECVRFDTKIPLLNGMTKSVEELEGSPPFWLYSINEKGNVVPGLCTKVWKTNFREDMVEVVIDNGKSIHCTSDHRFMMRDGSYKQARDLVPDDSLMPLYRKQRSMSGEGGRKYELIYHPESDGSGKRWEYTHSMVSKNVYGSMSKGWVTHHMDCTTYNNDPSNLRQMSNKDHREWHLHNPKPLFKALWNDPEWASNHKKRLRGYRQSEVGTKVGKQANRYRNEVTFEVIVHAMNVFVEKGITPKRQDMENEIGAAQDILYTRIRENGYSSWKAFKDHYFPPSYSALATRKSKMKKKLNHKVIEVKTTSKGEWVYDLQIEDHHNFATAAGVFVHNSLDSMQILEGVHGVESKRVSADLTVLPYKTLKDLMNEGRIIIPESALALKEILSLNLLTNGRVDHPILGSKDLGDAIACSAMGALELGGQESEEQERAYYGDAVFEGGSNSTPDMPYGFDKDMMAWDNTLSTEKEHRWGHSNDDW